MSLILKRIIMALLVSFGLAALFVPFKLSGKEVVVDRQVVRLVFLGYTDDPDSPVPDLATATRISEEEMSAFPTIQKKLVSSIPPDPPEPETIPTAEGIRAKALIEAIRAVRTPTLICVDQKEGDAFVEKFFGESRPEFALVYRGHLFRIYNDTPKWMKTLSSMKRGQNSEKMSFQVTLRCETPVRVFPSDMGTPLKAETLAKRPAVQEALEKPLAESIRSDMGKTSIPLADWTKTMGPIDGLTRIVHEGRLFDAEPRTEPHRKNEPSMIQPMDLRVFGAVVLALGLIAGRSLYRQMFSPGIPVCSPANVLAMDVVFVVFLGLCWVPMGDFFLVHGFGTESMIGEARFHGMGFICAILATLTLGPYITAMSSQRVIVDADGIQIRSNLREESLSWDKLTEIRTADFRVPVGRIGTVLSRRAARVLRLEGDGRSATILDPATKGRKRRIINAMLRHAPETLSDMIREAGENWEE